MINRHGSTHFGQDKVAQPADTVDVIAVDIARRKVGKVLLDSGEGSATPAGDETIGIGYGFFNGFRVQSPQFQRVVHTARYDTFPF